MRTRVLANAAITSCASILSLTGTSAFAQEIGDTARNLGHYHGHGMMWGGDTIGGMGMVFGFLVMILLVVAIGVAIVFAVRAIANWGVTQGASGPERRGDQALDMLRQRFAKGEIDAAEFDERKRLLSE
jgi:putative membrane protein